MAGMIDLNRAREEMKRLNLQGLLVCSPENYTYTSGYTPLLLDLYRLAPLSLCFIPLDDSLPVTLIVPETDAKQASQSSGFENILTFPVWWEVYQTKELESGEELSKDLSRLSRSLPEQYDPAGIAELTAALMKKLGLNSARIGIEFSFVSQQVFSLFSSASPDIIFIDSTTLWYRLRSVKNQEEIEHLKKACTITEAGILASSKAIQPGASIGILSAAFQQGVLAAALELGVIDLLGSVGGQPAIGPADGNPSRQIQAGISTTVKYDMQISIAHYYADVGRTYIFGEPTQVQTRIFEGLIETHRRLIESISPGKPVYEIFQAGRQSLDRLGLNRISRGHFGHSVGLDTKIEEPPFISATETTILQPGMVLAVETPCYYEGIGKYQIEDMVLVTDDGALPMNTLPKDWNL